MRRLATVSNPPSSSSVVPNVRVALLLSRPPLVLRKPHPLAKAYYEHSFALRHALSNPVATSFYFKAGSLPLRRFQAAEHAYETATYGAIMAGSRPDVGDLPSETPLEAAKDWAAEDAKRGEKSLERWPEEELFCLVQNADKSWSFPSTDVRIGEGLDEAVRRGLTGVDGQLGGQGMDSWLVTRKPIGVSKAGDQTVRVPIPRFLSTLTRETFFLRSHILSGQPTLSPSSAYESWSWLRASEAEDKMISNQRDGSSWQRVKSMLGLSEPAVI